MSRSIHTTWHERHLEGRYDYVNRELQRNRLKEIDRDLQKKHLIKLQIQSQRRSRDSVRDYVASINTETIPIKIIDAGEFIHYPASKDDLTGVLNRLPFDITYGLDSINLCLGAEYQEDNVDDLSNVLRDPYTGRVCLDDCEPIYLSGIAGTYWLDTCKIFLISFLQGDIETSLILSKAALSPKKVNVRVHAILKTINNHALRLGYKAEKLSLTEHEIRYLEESHIEELASSICSDRR